MSQTLKHLPPNVPPGPACVVRRAEFDDAADIAVVTELFADYALGLVGKSGAIEPQVLHEVVAGLKTMPGAFALIAFVGDKPAGLAVCLESYSTFRAARVINVHDLGVLAEFRSRGIANELLRCVEREAEERHCCKVTLEVRDDNHDARRLYRRRGYSGESGSPDLPGTFFLERIFEI